MTRNVDAREVWLFGAMVRAHILRDEGWPVLCLVHMLAAANELIRILDY